MDYKVVGIDLAKTVFQVCALNRAGKVAFNKTVSRSKLAEVVANLPRTLIAMEACGSANYWARRFCEMGHEIRLVPAQYVKPFVQRNKNDANDALAICEAAQRPKLHPVPIKSVEHLDIQFLHRLRQRHIKNRTASANQARALLRENGIAISKRLDLLLKAIPDILEDGENDLTMLGRQMLAHLQSEVLREKAEVAKLDKLLAQWVAHSEACQRLIAIPGYGPMVSSALVSAVGNASQFRNGRQLAAWLGLTPRHTGSAGKIVLLGSNKAGNTYLRYLLIHGARTVVNWADRKDDALSRWIQRLVERRGRQKAIVALANKCARMAWVLLARNETYRGPRTPADDSVTI